MRKSNILNQMGQFSGQFWTNEALQMTFFFNVNDELPHNNSHRHIFLSPEQQLSWVEMVLEGTITLHILQSPSEETQRITQVVSGVGWNSVQSNVRICCFFSVIIFAKWGNLLVCSVGPRSDKKKKHLCSHGNWEKANLKWHFPAA